MSHLQSGLVEAISTEEFLADRLGRTFADVVNDPEIPFRQVLEFFNDAARQQRMEDSEIHHDRAPLAGVVRELEANPVFHAVFSKLRRQRSARFRQAIGALVRVIMERRGWRTTGRKGSLGVRAGTDAGVPDHNTGGLSLWFLRAERYECEQGKPFSSVRERCQSLDLPGKAARVTDSNSTSAPGSAASDESAS